MATIRKRVWTNAKGERREAWQVDFVDQHGKRRHRQFDRKKDADKFLVAARGQVEAGTFSPDSTSITVTQAVEQWIERCERDGHEKSTIAASRSHLRNHITPLIGNVKLSRLTSPRVEKFVDEMLAGGRSRIQAKKVLGTLKTALKDAHRRGLVAQNAAASVNVRIPSRHKERVSIPSKAEVRAMIEAATGRTRPLLITAIFTGLRASELRALTWDHVDFKNKLIKVRQRADASGQIGKPKSATSRRDIPMAPMVVNALKEWKLACPKSELNLVFPGRGGGVACHNTIMAILGGRAHPLRHFFASWLIDQGFSPKRVQALMGHSSIQMTFDVYGHLFPQEDDHEQFAAGELALVG